MSVSIRFIAEPRFEVDPERGIVYSLDPASRDLGVCDLWINGSLIGQTKPIERWTPPWERPRPNRKARRGR